VQGVQQGGAELLICEGIVWGTQASVRALPAIPRYEIDRSTK
jgi:hypothetical protein